MNAAICTTRFTGFGYPRYFMAWAFPRADLYTVMLPKPYPAAGQTCKPVSKIFWVLSAEPAVAPLFCCSVGPPLPRYPV